MAVWLIASANALTATPAL